MTGKKSNPHKGARKQGGQESLGSMRDKPSSKFTKVKPAAKTLTLKAKHTGVFKKGRGKS